MEIARAPYPNKQGSSPALPMQLHTRLQNYSQSRFSGATLVLVFTLCSALLADERSFAKGSDRFLIPGKTPGLRFTKLTTDAWSSRFRCIETAWSSQWAAQEYAPCNSTLAPKSNKSAGRFSCYLDGGNPLDIDGTTKTPWFCTGRNVQVNYRTIDFGSIR